MRSGSGALSTWGTNLSSDLLRKRMVAGLCHFVISFVFFSFYVAAKRQNNAKRKDEITKKRQAKKRKDELMPRERRNKRNTPHEMTKNECEKTKKCHAK